MRNNVEHLNSSQQVHEIEFVTTSTKHNSMRNDRISIIFATLNFVEFIIQFMSLKLYSICDSYQLSSKCNNCMSFEIRRSLSTLLQIRKFWIIWIIFIDSKIEETRHELSMIKTRNNFICYSLKHVVFLYRVCIL